MKKHTTNINERAKSILGISRDEYALCQYVQYRSADPRSKAKGYCTDTKDEIAEFIGVTRPGLYKMVDKMVREGLIERDVLGYLCITGKWIDTESECKQSLQKGVNKVYSERKQSLQHSVNKVDTHNKVKKDIKKEDIEIEREAQAPNSHPKPENEPLQFEAEKKEKNTPPNSAPPPLKKEPRKKQSYTPDQVYELLPESVKPFFESVCQNGSLKTYLEYRRDQHKFSYNSATAAAIMIKSLYEFSGGDPDKAVLVVEQSIANGWKGIFKIKDSGQRKPAHIQNQQDLLSYVLANREKVWRESAGQ